LKVKKFNSHFVETVTIKDIAKALNLSTSTVSRALRDSYEINPETKRLVLDYAEKVNYHPNPIAQGLKENRSGAIGVIVPEIANHYFSQAISGIEAVAYARGYHVVIFQSQESYEREVVNSRYLAARKVDGLLISLSSSTVDVSHLKELHEKGLPLVFFDRVAETIETSKVVADNFLGTFEATEHLILSGRRCIAHMAGSPTLSITQERLAGYRSALDRHGIAYEEDLVHYCTSGLEEIAGIVSCLVSRSPRPDALLTCTDRLALGSLSELRKNGIRIPQDMSFAGFSNLQGADLLNPSLTTVVQPAFEMGQTAASLLLEIIDKKNKNVSYRTLKLPTRLIVRESSML